MKHYKAIGVLLALSINSFSVFASGQPTQVTLRATAEVVELNNLSMDEDGNVEWSCNNPDAPPPMLEVAGELVTIARRNEVFSRAELEYEAERIKEQRLALQKEDVTPSPKSDNRVSEGPKKKDSALKIVKGPIKNSDNVVKPEEKKNPEKTPEFKPKEDKVGDNPFVS